MLARRRFILTTAASCGGVRSAFSRTSAPPEWLDAPPRERLADRFAAPAGHRPVAIDDGAFGAWLRALPLRPPGAPILLHTGKLRDTQSGAAAIVDIDVGRADLQQCADAIIRLRAEYLRASGRRHALVFRFTNGERYAYADYLAGRRPIARGNSIAWIGVSASDDTRRAFRAWLDIVFTYAGTISLARELARVDDPTRIEPGDVLIQPGSPGHAIIAVDVAEREGRRVALFAQSFMPAQSVHVLRGPIADAWYPIARDAAIDTPDWRFTATDLKRFPPA
jgi:hypothetical protein